MNTNEQQLLDKMTALAADCLHEQLINTHVFRSCLNCNHFNSDTSHCSQFDSTPPAAVIVFSCKDGWKSILPF